MFMRQHVDQSGGARNGRAMPSKPTSRGTRCPAQTTASPGSRLVYPLPPCRPLPYPATPLPRTRSRRGPACASPSVMVPCPPTMPLGLCHSERAPTLFSQPISGPRFPPKHASRVFSALVNLAGWLATAPRTRPRENRHDASMGFPECLEAGFLGGSLGCVRLLIAPGGTPGTLCVCLAAAGGRKKIRGLDALTLVWPWHEAGGCRLERP